MKVRIVDGYENLRCELDQRAKAALIRRSLKGKFSTFTSLQLHRRRKNDSKKPMAVLQADVCSGALILTHETAWRHG